MPINDNAFFGMLGIAMRAGALTFGEGGVLKAIAGGQAALVLLDAGASERSKKMFRDSCAYYSVRLVETEPDRLGQAVGKPGRMSAAVTAGKISEKLIAMTAREDMQSE